jgi:tRNA threonylcarbamoyl adenosine modification protein YeaZ
MKTLAFDLSTREGSIAVADDDRLVVSSQWSNDRRNSAPFFHALNQIIREYSLPEMIVVGTGPGSYTGTRIAISAAVGLQATTGATLCGLPSISAISADPDYAVLGDAKRSSFFFARIRDGALVDDAELMSEPDIVERISQMTIPIYTSDDLPQFEQAKLRFPSAALLCQRTWEFPQNLGRAPLSPIYLREPHITVARTKK